MLETELKAQLERHLTGWDIRLDSRQWELLDSYLGDVLEYNRKVNLTAAKDSAELLRRHAADALAALPSLKRLLTGSPRPNLADVGSGGGFVGICLKIAWPQATITLIEPVYRKYCFLNWTATRLALPGLKVYYGRAQRLAGAGYDAALARALAPLPEAISLLSPLLAPAGIGIIYQSAAPDPADPGLLRALEAARARMEPPVPYHLPGEREARNLVIIRNREPAQ